MAAEFTGLAPAALEFFEDLEERNEKAWFDEHRDVYLQQVKAPMLALLAELEEEFGAARVFRINRDIRFSADKRPYKTQQGAIIDRGGRGVLYVSIGADGLTVGCGAPHLDSEQVARWRAAVAGPPGEELAALIADLRGDSYVVGTLGSDGITPEGDLKRVPKPYPPDHPRADLLRLKKVVAARSWSRPGWLGTRRTLTEVRTVWTRTAPLADWLDANVGASSGRVSSRG